MLAAILGAVLISAMHAERLSLNFLDHSLVLPAESIRASWWVEGGEKQAGYQIQIRRGESVVWDSGEVRSTRAQLIEFPKLEAGKHYEWRVQLTDEKQVTGPWSEWKSFGTAPARFTGLWITHNVENPPPQTPHNGYHSEMENSDSVEKWVEVTFAEPPIVERPGKPAKVGALAMDGIRFWPARPFDFSRDIPGFLFPLRFRVEIDGRKIYETAEDVTIPANNAPLEIRFPKTVGQQIRVIFTKLRERDSSVFGVAMAEMQVMSGTHVVSLNRPVKAKDSVEHNHWSTRNLTNGDLTSHPVRGLEALPPTRVRKEFMAEKPVRVTLYATALGAYQAFVNGRRVGDEVLAPGWTDYLTRVRYQGFDVTDMVREGTNEIAANVGDAWFAGRLGMAQSLDERGFSRAVYGRDPLFAAMLVIEKANGKTETIITDSSWRQSTLGPIVSSDIYDGEVFDARREYGKFRPVKVARYPSKIVPQTDQPIRVTRVHRPLETRDIQGAQILDFGQNLVGFLKLTLKGPAGSTVTLRHAEMLQDNGDIYTENLRGAPQIDRVTLGDEELTWEPSFTYHGFRYAKIELPAGVELKEVTARVFHTDAPIASDVTTSDPMVNRLWQNVVWTQRANLMSTATDCPQRDERLGWTGDLHAFGHTANFVMDLDAFTEKWLTDLRDSQADDGRFPDFAPHPFGKNRHFTGVPGWGDAAVSVAWHRYLRSGDTAQFRRHLPAITHYLDWLEKTNPNHLWVNARHNDYGDWLNGDTLRRKGWNSTGSELPKPVFATMVWFESLLQSAKMGRLNGDLELAAEWESRAKQVQTAFLGAYLQADGKIQGDTQAGYAMALDIGILPENARAKAFEHLIAALKGRDNHLTTGFHTTHRLMNVLTRMGRADLAYTLLENKTFPSWGYTIENGATTIWERWDGFVKGRGFQDPGMNSFNHWALGAVGEWMMQTLVGIQPIEPGWTHFRLAPVPGGTLSFASGHFDAPTGRIESSWKRDGEKTTYRFRVPANTRATVELPGREPFEVGPGEHAF
jgi:alpha-L-rhamnosidase